LTNSVFPLVLGERYGPLTGRGEVATIELGIAKGIDQHSVAGGADVERHWCVAASVVVGLVVVDEHRLAGVGGIEGLQVQAETEDLLRLAQG